MTDANLIVFGNKQLEEIVWKHRQPNNTVFILKELSSFQDYWFSGLIEKARQSILNQPNFQFKDNPQFAIK